MNKTPEQIEKEIKQAKLGALIFFIISMTCFAASLGLIIAAIVIGAKDAENWYPFGYGAGITMTIAFTFLILRSVYFTSKIRFYMVMEEAKKQQPNIMDTPVVDVKPVEAFKEEASRENKLYQQYEKLYEQGYITKEELEQKRKELLN